MKKIFTIGIGLLAGLLLCSCSSTRQSTASYNPVRFSTQTQHLLPSPRMLKEDYCHPEQSTRHKFRWGSFGTDWVLSEKDTPMEYAGFYIRRPLDLGNVAHSQSLQFSVRPIQVTENLTLALISGNGQTILLPGKSLADYPSNSWHQGWSTFKIDVVHFKSPETSDQSNFDWSDIRQVRLLKINPDIELGQVEIRNLRFRPDTLSMLR